jgi:signal transduction histidine kinase
VLVVFFRIIQEALNNIIKHSLAKHVNIYLHNSDDEVSLLIQDDGTGFDVGQASLGFGMSSMSERALQIGADLQITSQPNQGTEVSLRWKKP